MKSIGIRSTHSFFRPFVAAVVYLTYFAIEAAAGPLALRDSAGSVRPSGRDVRFAQHFDEAVDLLREHVRVAPACRAYFKRHGVDLNRWLTPGSPPYVVSRKLHFSSRRSVAPVCGGAQGRPPFELLFVDTGCFRKQKICDLASLLLHEMGHLARRDTRDNEPPDFFAACHLNVCIDPSRYD